MAAGVRRERTASPVPKDGKAGSQKAPPATEAEHAVEQKKPLIVVLSDEGLQHIADHKYVAGNYTPLDMVLNPWWLALTEMLPRWLAPNVITFTGTSVLMVTYFCAWWCSPDFSVAPPRWLSFLSAFAIFVYQTLDACDGKQARRIGLQTPMGQLFDHGCDLLACLSHHSMGALLLLASPTESLFSLASLQSGLFIAQWQEYYTGVLKTSLGSWGVTEMQYGLMLGNIAAGIAGPEATAEAMHTQVSLPFVGQISISSLAVFGWIMNCWVLFAISFTQTIQFTQESAPEKRRGLLLSALRDMIPVIALDVCVVLWSQALKVSSIRLIIQLTGLLFVLYSWQVVIFSMSKMPNVWLHPTLLVYVALMIMSHYVNTTTVVLVTSVFTLGVAVYMMVWIVSVTAQLTKKLDIKVFSVSKALWEKKD